MFVGWNLLLIVSLLIGIIYCQDNNPMSMEMEPDARVVLTVETRPKSSVDVQTSEPFSCHECLNCKEKSNLTTRICQSHINMCYTIHKRINNTNQIIRRGCSTSRNLCAVPDVDQSNLFDSITCCTTHKCNQGIMTFKPMFAFLLLNLFLLISNN